MHASSVLAKFSVCSFIHCTFMIIFYSSGSDQIQALNDNTETE